MNELKNLSECHKIQGSFLISLVHFFGLQFAKDKEEEEEARRAKRLASLVHEECQTDLLPGGSSTPDPRKRPRELTESPEDIGTKKPEKRPKAVIITPEEGVRYPEILKNLKSRVNPEELGVKIGGIRDTRTEDLLFEVKCAAEDRGRLYSAFSGIVGESGLFRYLVPTAEVVILDIKPTAETEEVTKVVRSRLQEETSARIKVCMIKKPFRGTRKPYVLIEQERALELLKAAHIKIA